jgi:cytosine/uracil/thiamine/allantoin permease
MKSTLSKLAALALVTAPAVSFAQVDVSYFQSIIDGIGRLIAMATPVLFGLAILAFIWGIFKAFILGGHDPEKQQEGKQLMLYAVIGFFAMVAIWGLVGLLGSIVGVNPEAAPPIPGVPGRN